MKVAPTCYRFAAATVFAVLAIQSPAGISTRQTRRKAETPLRQWPSANQSRDYGKLPLAFEPNVGQTDARVRFLARDGGMTTFFTDRETVMVLSRSRQAAPPEIEQAVVRMKLEGAGQPGPATGLEKLPGISNYFIGNDPAKWRRDVPHFARIQYEGVYPGIDLVWYGNQQRLEYDFLVAPGADPKQIQVAYEGVESLLVDAGGDLVLRTALGEIRQQKPRVYQDVGGKQVEVRARYAVLASNRVTFALGRYDRMRQLRIDPVVLVYSTYLGGNGYDSGQAIAVDGAGSAYVTGYTISTNFPTQSPYQATNRGFPNAFVTKLTPAGDALVYSTYLGGSGIAPTGFTDVNAGRGIAVDGAGSAYVTGDTNSTDFPTQSPYQASLRGSKNAFVTKLAPAGNALVYSTYLGGRDTDSGRGIAVDGTGSAYVTGATTSTNFPIQTPYQATLQGSSNAFVSKLTPAGNALVYSTYLGGSRIDRATSIAVDGAGSAYVTGDTLSTNFPTQSPYQATLPGSDNAFVTKLTPAGNALVYSTYLGGSNLDFGAGIAVDGVGSAYITGITYSTNFPTQAPYQATLRGRQNAFVTKLTPAGNALVYSTYLGGSTDDLGIGIAVDGAGSAYVTGYTFSTNFPTQSPYQATLQGSTNVFVTKLAPAGNALLYSTYLRGSIGYAIAVDGAGSAYITGQTGPDFPTQSPYQATLQGNTNAFVTKLASPAISLTIGKTHTGNFTPGQNGATYAVTVSSAAGSSPTTGAVTVTETVPPGMTLVSMAGAGWTCPAGGTTCTRSDALNGGSSYPAITVTVNVASSAATLLTNQVSVSGGGAATSSAADTAIVSTCTPTVSPTSLAWGPAGGTLTITLNNGGCGWTATPNVPWLAPAVTSGTSGALNVTVGANVSSGIQQRSGTITVAGQTVTVTQAAYIPGRITIPSLVSLNPFQGSGPNATLTLVYAHPNGWATIQSAEFIINPRWEANSRGGGCYVKYAPSTGLFTLTADDGNSVAGTAVPGSGGSISNSQCTLNAASSSATGSGNNLTIVASLTFQPSFAGQRHIWMQAVDYNNLSTNWLVYGVWFPTQSTVRAIPWYRIYDPFSKSYLYTSDQNEYNTLGSRGFTLQGVSGLVMNGSTTVGGASNMAWYRVFVNATSSHFWTSDRSEFLNLVNAQQAYVGEGVAAFVMPYINAQGQVSPPVANTIPFYREAFSGQNLHFWTTDSHEAPAGYSMEGIACYIFPASGAQGIGTVAAQVNDDSPTVVSAGNGVIAPGQVLSIYGHRLGGAVLFNGIPAQVESAGDNEIQVVVPQELAGASEVRLEVEHRGRRSKPVTLDVVPANPSIFGTNQYGRGIAHARNEDGTINSAEHPAARGSVVTLDTTGYNTGNLPIEVHIGGHPAEVISTHGSGTRPGVSEVRVRVPDTVEPALFQPVVLHVGNLFSQPGVGLAIQ